MFLFLPVTFLLVLGFCAWTIAIWK